MCWKVSNKVECPFLKTAGLARIHFTFQEVCTEADLLTLLDLLDHDREGIFPCYACCHPDEPAGQ